MDTRKVQDKILSTLNNIVKVVNCPKCCKNGPCYSIGCGHTICAACLDVDISQTNNANQFRKKLCPICDKKLNLEITVFDDLFNSLSYETGKLEEIIQKKQNLKKQKNIIHTGTQVCIGQASREDKSLQTDATTTKSFSVQCNLKNSFKSVETQTDSNDITQASTESCTCCLKTNLKRILKLNICSSFNAIIEGLLKVDKCSIPNESNNSTIETEKIERISNLENNSTCTNREVPRFDSHKKENIQQNDFASTLEINFSNKEIQKTVTRSSGKQRKRQAEQVISLNDNTDGQDKTRENNDNEKFAIAAEKIEMPISVSKRKKIAIIKSFDDVDQFNLSDASTSASTSTSNRRSPRSTKIDKSNLVILSSGLNDTQTKKMETAAHILNFEIVTEWSPKITHLVVSQANNTKKKDMLTLRSKKYLMALVGKKWIVSFDWIVSCIRSNKLIPENSFEIRGTTRSCVQGCPARSRSEKMKLFSGYAIFFKEPYPNFNLTLEEVKKIVRIADGIIVEDQTEWNQYQSGRNDLKLLLVTDIEDDSSTPNVKKIKISNFIDSICNLQNL